MRRNQIARHTPIPLQALQQPFRRSVPGPVRCPPHNQQLSRSHCITLRKLSISLRKYVVIERRDGRPPSTTSTRPSRWPFARIAARRVEYLGLAHLPRCLKLCVWRRGQLAGQTDRSQPNDHLPLVSRAFLTSTCRQHRPQNCVVACTSTGKCRRAFGALGGIRPVKPQLRL